MKRYTTYVYDMDIKAIEIKDAYYDIICLTSL